MTMPNRNAKGQDENKFIGVVEDNLDPLELGRVRVRVFNHNDNGTPTPTEDLPWASISGLDGDGFGWSPTWIQIGTKVSGHYMDGSTKRVPVVDNAFWTIPGMDINKHGVNKLARGENSITKEPMGPEPESPYAAEYPYNKVLSTPGGHVIELDDTPEGERIHIYHKAGTYIEIDFEGRMVRKVMGNDITVVAKDSDVHIEGKSNVYIKGDVTMKVDGNYSSEVSGDMSLKAGGNMTIEAARIDLN